MQQLINPFTLAFSAGIVCWALGTCFFALSRTSRVYPGFSLWTIAAFLSGAGSILVGLRGLVPDFLSFLIGNTLVILSVIVIKRGCFVFFDEPQQPKFDTLSLLLFMVIQSYFSFVNDSLHARIIIGSLSHAANSLSMLYGLWRRQSPDAFPVSRLLSGSLLFFAMYNLLRGTFSVLFLVFSSESSAGIILGLSVLIQIASVLFIYFALLVCNAQRIESDLQLAKEQIRTLYGILPICCHCKKIRSDSNAWQPVEQFVRDHSHAQFSHGICPDCIQKHYPEMS